MLVIPMLDSSEPASTAPKPLTIVCQNQGRSQAGSHSGSLELNVLKWPRSARPQPTEANWSQALYPSRGRLSMPSGNIDVA